MREQLIQYVGLLFAGAPDSEDIRQEILQNTLDRFDDLVAQGKSPEAAYRLAITGIGDINEILSSSASAIPTSPAHMQTSLAKTEEPMWKKVLQAAAIGLYILAMIPLFVLSEMGMDTLGLCGTLSIVAVATVAILVSSKQKNPQEETSSQPSPTPAQPLRRSIRSIIWTIGLAAYFITSFLSGAWHITWLIFPLIGSVQGLVNAIMDLKEVARLES